MKKNKIIEMLKNNNFLSYLVTNKFILYFSIKEIKKNENENLFFMNSKIFRILKNVLFFFILWSSFILEDDTVKYRIRI